MGQLATNRSGAHKRPQLDRGLLAQLAIEQDEGAAALKLALARVAEAEKQLQAQRQRIQLLETLAQTDELTGVANRRGFTGELRRELSSAARGTSPGGLLMLLDLDEFKPVNDGYGHPAGDALLQLTAHLLVGAVREMDVVGRLGGDEFGVLLLDIAVGPGSARAAQITRRLNTARLSFGEQTIPLRISAGFAAYTAGDTEDAVIARADAALYQRKRERRSAA